MIYITPHRLAHTRSIQPSHHLGCFDGSNKCPMDSFRMRSRSSSIQDSWKPCFLHIALQHIYRIAPAKSGNVLYYYRWRSPTPKIPASDGVIIIFIFITIIIITIIIITIIIIIIIIIVWKQCRFRKLQFQTCSWENDSSHALVVVFFHVFFGATGYPQSVVEECIVKWIIRNCTSRPAQSFQSSQKKNCGSSESYKPSIIFLPKGFPKKCRKPGDKMTTIFMIFGHFGPWFSINFRTFPCGPGGLESLRNASVTLMGHEAFHVATEVHFTVDLGLLVLHVAHLKPDPIKSHPEMKTRRWYGLLGKKKM